MDPRKWINYVRNYGPHAKNSNMFDERIQRTLKRTKIKPLNFQHPYLQNIRDLFDESVKKYASVILTGDAGDGKTHLCRELWGALGGGPAEWGSDNPHITLSIAVGDALQTDIHFIRDLSAWVPQKGLGWQPERKALLERFSVSVFEQNHREYFVIACNDGQLTETWKRLGDDESVIRFRELIETLLVENRQNIDKANVHLFNLSRVPSATLFDLASSELLNHPAWANCIPTEATPLDKIHVAFRNDSPIRRNYEILKNPQFKSRIRILFELCDYNDLHIPVRQIFLMLSNALLGHPDCKEKLMHANDVAHILEKKTGYKANLFHNIFGANLSNYRRENIPIYRYLNMFRIGFETTNALDELLIFGNHVTRTKELYQQVMGEDTHYGADKHYRQAQDAYLEAGDEDERKSKIFLDQLVAHRRGLFFKIPAEWTGKYAIWNLTIFKYGGEYRTEIMARLKKGDSVRREIIRRLVKGLNRIFVGMLVNEDSKLCLASSLSFSNARISRILEDEIPIKFRRGVGIRIDLEEGKPYFRVFFGEEITTSIELHMIRFEFLSRVAEGALPTSFSKECYEDMMSFKSKILSDADKSRDVDEEDQMLRLIALSDEGKLDIQKEEID